MSSENCIRSFALGTLSLFLISAAPVLAQGPMVSPQVPASIHAIPSEGNPTIREGGPEALLQAQLRAQQLEIEILKGRVKALESTVESLNAAKSEPATAAAVAGTAGSDAAAARTGAREEARAALAASSPADPPPFEPPHELLPDIGQIGAEVSLLTGGSTNPFDADKGGFFAGFIDLPLRKFPARGGKWSYEIMVGLQRNVTQNRPVTSGVFALVNNALSGNLFSPLPVTINTEQRMKVLTVVPFALKYTVTKFDRHRFRPYGVVGFGTYVTISSQETKGFDANKFISDPAVAGIVNSLLSGPLIGGLAPEAPELRARGLPNGQGDIRFGVNFGGGLEYRIAPKFSIGFDYRGNKMEGRNSFFSTFAAKETFHF